MPKVSLHKYQGAIPESEVLTNGFINLTDTRTENIKLLIFPVFKYI